MKSIKIEVVAPKTDDIESTVVLIEGDLTLKNARLLKDELSKVLGHFKHLEIKLNNIKNIDISALQILYSIVNHGKGTVSEFSVPSETGQLMEKAGLTKIFPKQV